MGTGRRSARALRSGPTMAFQVTERQRRWLDALLVMSTTVVAIILIPIVAVLVRHVPNLPRIAAVVVVYGLLLGGIVVIAVVVANNLATSITSLVSQVPEIRNDLPDLLAPWQQRLNAIGFGQVDL